ncbi:hypothetical protein V491_04843 [Pseudogymnoascus sp. VKM F-3775]|nr:hypothetical protein V491_04843 [Pseudogymnoascus sp. VKM F-3775]
MSSNVGLTTPRGSGTSGYVQRNLAHLKPREQFKPYPTDGDLKHRQRQPDKEILEHDRKRDVEVKVFALQDKLQDEGYVGRSVVRASIGHPNTICSVDEDEIEKRTEELRQKLLGEMKRGYDRRDAKGLKSHQVHELAEAKIRESDRFRSALGISKNYEEGSHWKKQEERIRESLEKGGNDDKERKSAA